MAFSWHTKVALIVCSMLCVCAAVPIARAELSLATETGKDLSKENTLEKTKNTRLQSTFPPLEDNNETPSPSSGAMASNEASGSQSVSQSDDELPQETSPPVKKRRVIHNKKLERLLDIIVKHDQAKKAEKKSEISVEEQLMYDISGLIVEETMTHIGYEFYEYFYAYWQAPESGYRNYNILITEQAHRLWGSRISVFVDRQLV